MVYCVCRVPASLPPFGRGWQESRRLSPEVERIKGEVCRIYEVNQGDLSESRRDYHNEPRNIVIYLTRYLRSDSLKEIGEVFEIKKYSTISSVIRRVKREIRKDKNLKECVEELSARLSKGQR